MKIKIAIFNPERISIRERYDECTRVEVVDFKKNEEYDYVLNYSNSQLKNDDFNGVIINKALLEKEWFNIIKYDEIRKRKISIIANYCIGGHLYKLFNMPFYSPTINCYCFDQNYMEFISMIQNRENIKMEEYISKKQIDQTIGYEYWVPKGVIHKSCVWYFNHSISSQNGIDEWNKRCNRINFDDCYYIMIISSEEMAYRFERLNSKKKIGIFYKELGLSHIYYLKEWNDPNVRLKYNFNYPRFANQLAIPNSGIGNINWIKELS